MRRLLTLAATITAALAIGVLPSAAVTDGQPDGNGHPFVGLMVAKDADGTPMWRCSGTLLSATLFLTAGHCTEPPAASIEIWFDPDEASIRAKGYPFTGDVSGTPFTHPEYDPNVFYIRDLGAVVLDAPVQMSQYGVLPGLDQLDVMKTRRGHQDLTFTAVGYGLQRINPVFIEASLTRMFARPHLITMNAPGFTGDFSLLLSNNHSTGGTCFGDSGGPNFLGTSHVIAGVTSFGLNGNCAGTGGVFRLDRSWSLDWLQTAFAAHLP